jgi:apolipoprotein N-acyltransferase
VARLPLRPLAYLAAGAVLPLAFAPFGQFWLAPLSLAVLFWLLGGETPRAAFWNAYLFGFASFLGGTYWTYISIRVYGGQTVPIAAIIMLGLVAILALYTGLMGWICARWFPRRGARAWLFAMPAVFVAIEWLRSWLLTGFGWLSVGYSQTDSWLMSYAPILGIHGMSLAVALTAGALVTLTAGEREERRVALGCLIAVWGVGWAMSGYRFTDPQGRFVSVALVQGAVPQDLKWRRDQFGRTLELYRELTFAATDADLVIWPEVAIPARYDDIADYLETVQARALERSSTVMLGILLRDQAAGGIRNGFVALTPEHQFYSKRHLVPYGEYFPVPDFVRAGLRAIGLPSTDTIAGPQDQPLIEAQGERIAVSICYEDVFGFEQLDWLPDASVLVNVSNDAWFGDSIAPHQHLQIARVRAAEAGRYLLRSTNTGVSAVISPFGQIVDSAPQFEPWVVRETVSGFTGATPYVRLGNYPIVVVLLLALTAQRLAAKIKTSRTESDPGDQ